LKTFSTKYGPALNRAKGNCGLDTTFSAQNLGFTATARVLGCSLGLAFLAVSWIVYEILSSKKQLFAGGEDKRL
jgi:hypothetical protein